MTKRQFMAWVSPLFLKTRVSKMTRKLFELSVVKQLDHFPHYDIFFINVGFIWLKIQNFYPLLVN